MPYYRDLGKDKTRPKGETERILERLIRLREHLSREIPQRTHQETILLATWNIREFDSETLGKRIPEAFHYIAEIIDRFDIIAIQEIYRDLSALERVLELLGSSWHYIVTDVTEGMQGNDERMAFLYDSRKIKFGGLASELVLPPIKTKDKKGESVYKPVAQIARTPFVCGFKAGWTNFMLATVHILYGDHDPNYPERVEEIQQLAKFLKDRAEDETAWSNNLILLGDFNIFSPNDETMKALTNNGFVVPPELQFLPSNVTQNKYYDQIAFQVRPGQLNTTGKAGVFNFYQTVFTDEDEKIYADDAYMGERYLTTQEGEKRQDPARYYSTFWRTHQMSDHLPMWVELRIDYTDEYLQSRLDHERAK